MTQLSRRVRVLYFTMMLAAGVMPLVPDEISFFSVFFVVAFAAWCLDALRSRMRGKKPKSRATAIALSVFFASILLSFPIALSNGVPPGEWVRGALPFCFLLVYLLFPALGAKDGQFVLGTLVFTVLCWLVKNLARSLGEFAAGGASRITYLNADFGIPFALVGLPLLLFFVSRRRPLTSAIFGVCLLLLVIATGYRSQAIIAVALWVAYVALQRRRRRLIFGVATLAVGAAAFTVFAGSRFGDEYLARFGDFESEVQSSRAVEALYAVQKFRQSPLVGKGLGFPVPIAINSFGVTDAPPPDQPDHVGYIHNVWLYLLMDLGVIGLAAYLALFGSVVMAGLRRKAREDVQIAAAATLVALLIYFTVEAAFRVIQVNLVLGSLCAVLAKSEPDQ
jgi:hypothetical protein